MKKLMLFGGLVAFGALPMAMVGCGETDDGMNMSAIKSCTSGSDCQSTEICHPTGKICVMTCKAAADCPDSAKNCAPLKDETGKDTALSVCQCSTSELCAKDGSASVCHSADKVCEPKCTADADCKDYGTRTCDTAKGECIAAAGKCTADTDCKDATKPLCNTTTGACIAKCTQNSDCTDATNKFCNAGTGKCQAQAACDPTKTAPGTNGGQDTCATGEYCDGTTKVCVKSQGTCAAAVAKPVTPAASAPIAYNVTKTGQRTTTLTTACPPGTVAQFKGFWFDKEGDMPTSNLFTGKDVQVVSKAGIVGDTFQNISVTMNADNKSGEFTFELCTDTSNNIQGVFLKDSAGNSGNVACFTF